MIQGGLNEYQIAPGDAGIAVIVFQSSLVAPAPLSMVVMFEITA